MKINNEMKIFISNAINLDYIRQQIKEKMERDNYISILNTCGVTEEDMKKAELESIFTVEKFKSLAEAFNDVQNITYEEPTIEKLKKQIKYSKNPLEIKMLNKKLNELYKKQKA